VNAVAQRTDEAPASGPMLITMEQAAHRLGLGRSKTYELVLRGDLPSVSIGHSRRIDVDDLRRFVEQLKATRTT
jgi:excisionase family DNA binding protein